MYKSISGECIKIYPGVNISRSYFILWLMCDKGELKQQLKCDSEWMLVTITSETQNFLTSVLVLTDFTFF